MRTDSDRNLSAEADPNPARKTRERVLTGFVIFIKEKGPLSLKLGLCKSIIPWSASRMDADS